jgi:SAM-dependent methyltransferase
LTASVAPAISPTDFDDVAGIYDDVFPAHIREHYLRRRTGYILRHARGTTALDIGAGTGLLAERLHDAGIAVSALDPYPQMLDRLGERRPAIPRVVARGHDLPFPNDTFDLTYSVAVMHHIADPDLVRRTLADMVRVTRRSGRILVWDHNPLNPYWPLLMRRVPQDSGAERLIPMAELIAGLTTAGADIVRAERMGLIPEFLPRRLLGLAARLERGVEAAPGLRRLCAHNVVLAVKR